MQRDSKKDPVTFPEAAHAQKLIPQVTGKAYARKSIAKRKLVTKEDVEDVRREVEIMHYLAGHSNVIAIKAAYEDAVSVHFVMELCVVGELFERICHRWTSRGSHQSR
ncbi:hypothetical protein Droror1_Dr00002260 [Drosera rotundifolia]